MLTRNRRGIAFALAVTCGVLALLIGDALAAGRGGGARGGGSRGGRSAARGGGGYSRGGGSSVRYSSSRPSSSRSRPTTRPSTPSYSRPTTRPTTPSYSRPTTRPSTPSYSRPATRPTTPSYRPVPNPSRPATRPATPSYRPPNYGSISNGGSSGINRGTVTLPGGGTAGAITGPGGGGAAGIVGPGGGAVGGIRGPGGGAAGGVRGPGGGAVGGVTGPGGGAAGGVRGPGGGAVGGVTGPGGSGAVGIRGSGGYGAAAIRTPSGTRVVSNLPPGSAHYPVGGNDYWYNGYSWYVPYWDDDDFYYRWVYPPIGYFYPSLPPGYTTTTYDNTTYYCDADGVYYQAADEGGQEGYKVVEAPEDAQSSEGPNPFDLLKGMSDYIAGLGKFSAVVDATIDEVLPTGQKVQRSRRTMVSVDRGGRLAADVIADQASRQFVYDGKTLSVLDKTKKLYAVAAMPPTIDGMLDTATNAYGMVFPLGDLLYKDPYDRLASRVELGQYLGEEKVGKFDCHHLAFTQANVNWEIWIEKGARPVPRKVSIDYKNDEASPRYGMLIVGWADSPTFLADQFTFQPPADARKVNIAPKTATAGGAAEPESTR